MDRENSDELSFLLRGNPESDTQLGALNLNIEDMDLEQPKADETERDVAIRHLGMFNRTISEANINQFAELRKQRFRIRT